MYASISFNFIATSYFKCGRLTAANSDENILYENNALVIKSKRPADLFYTLYIPFIQYCSIW